MIREVVDTITTQSEPGHGRPDPSLSAVMGERRQLIDLAYRLLGSLAEAEDVVQETFARWYSMSRQQREAIESPGAWLMAFDVAGDRINHIWAVRNPDKLRPWTAG